MDQFKSKYPALVLAFTFIAALGKDFAAQDQSWGQKFSASLGLVPQGFALMGQSAAIKDQLLAVKGTPEDMVLALELLVQDMGFTSEKAQSAIAAVEPVLEKLAELVAPVQNMISVLKA